MTVSCGLYDSDLAVWDDVEAHVLTNGRWYTADTFQMFHEAQINVEWLLMHRLLADAPPLPEGAFVKRPKGTPLILKFHFSKER